MTDATPQPSPHTSLGRLLTGAAFAITFVAGGLVLPSTFALAQGMGHAGMAGHGDMHAMARAHIQRMLSAVGATDDQKARIDAIFAGVHHSMAPLHGKMEETHHELARILTSPVIDRGALEELRTARMADLDQASRALTRAIADAAEVLTPAQRAKLASMIAAHHPPS